jgi:cytochrome c556
MRSRSKLSRYLISQLATAVVVAVTCASVTLAQTQPPAGLIKERQQGLKKLGAALKLIRDELRSGSPDATKIRSASVDITAAASAIDGWFPAGTGPDAGVKTDAKAEIWTDATGFAAARDRFVREASRWNQLGGGGDATAWNEAAASLGQSCKGCHDKYRVKRE